MATKGQNPKKLPGPPVTTKGPRGPGFKEPPPFHWKLIARSDGYNVVLRKTIEKKDVDDALSNLREQGLYEDLKIHAIESRIPQPKWEQLRAAQRKEEDRQARLRAKEAEQRRKEQERAKKKREAERKKKAALKKKAAEKDKKDKKDKKDEKDKKTAALKAQKSKKKTPATKKITRKKKKAVSKPSRRRRKK